MKGGDGEMKLYVKLYFNSEGPSPLIIVPKVKKIGFKPVVGQYDFVMDFETPEEYAEIINKLHAALHGSRVLYTIQSRKE